MDDVTQDSSIPRKMFYKIGEISQILGVKPYVLRYWESEFKQIRPSKNRFGQRVYRPKDLDILLRVKKLLYNEKFTIAGARKQLALERLQNRQKAKKVTGHKKDDLDKSDIDRFMNILREQKTLLQEILNIFDTEKLKSESNIGA